MSNPSASTDPVERAREACLRVLEHRPHSRHELVVKLRRKGFSSGVIDPLLDRLTEVGLVDDAAFARAWVESRQRRRPQGRRGLQAELAKRGVARPVIDDVLGELLDQEDPVELALQALQPKAAQLRALPREGAERRAAQFLQRRGFDYDTVRQALERFIQG